MRKNIELAINYSLFRKEYFLKKIYLSYKMLSKMFCTVFIININLQYYEHDVKHKPLCLNIYTAILA